MKKSVKEFSGQSAPLSQKSSKNHSSCHDELIIYEKVQFMNMSKICNAGTIEVLVHIYDYIHVYALVQTLNSRILES